MEMLICRVCLENADDLISLKSESADCLSLLHMLSEFTIKNAEDKLSTYICITCARNLDIAYVFKRKYEDSIVKFIRSNQTVKNEENIGDANWKKYSHHHKDTTQQPLQININDVHQFYQTSVIHSNNPVVDLTDQSPCEVESFHVEDKKPLAIQISDVQTLYPTSIIDLTDDFQENDLNIKHENENDNLSMHNPHVTNEEAPSMRISRVQTLNPTSGMHSNREKKEDVQEKKVFEGLDNHENQKRKSQSHESHAHESKSQAVIPLNSNVPTKKLKLESSSDLVEDKQTIQEAKCSMDDIEQSPPKRLTRLSAATINAHVQDKKHVHPTSDSINPLNKNHDKELEFAESSTLDPHGNQSTDLLSLVSNVIQCDNPSEADLVTDANFPPPQKNKSRIVWTRNVDTQRTLNKQILNEIYTQHHRRNKPFRCDVCHRWFKTKGHIKTHRMLHLEAERDIRCGQCALRFLTRSHFRAHQCLF